MFLSYDHEDVARATRIASALENAGHPCGGTATSTQLPRVAFDRAGEGIFAFSTCEPNPSVTPNDAKAVLVNLHPEDYNTWARGEIAAARELAQAFPVMVDASQVHTAAALGRSLPGSACGKHP